MKKIGVIANYFTKLGVAVVILTDGDLKKGELIHIKGFTTDFEQIIDSMQIERQDIESATRGEKIGLKVKDRVRLHDEVFKKE